MYFSEFKILSRYSIPIIGSEVLRNTLLMMPVLFIGHRSAFELAAITLGSSYCNVTGWCLLIGMDSALDTLCSQAYAAARTREDKKKIGSILQRGFVILMAITLFIFALWEFTEPILLLCRQDPDISRVAGIYSKYSRFGLIPYVVFECEKKLMQIQGIMYVPTFIIGSALPVNALLHYYFIFSKWSPLPDELAYIGSPFSTAITFTYMSIVGIIYIKYVKGSECWGGINLKSIFNFKKWIEFLKLGIPGAIMVCNEWWAYEVCALIAGILGEIPLAIQSIFSSITNYSYNIPMGLSIATTLRLGYNLGEGNSKKSSATTKISILMAFAFGIINSLVLLIFRYKLPKIFTDDDEVIKGCSQILIIGAFYQLSDGLATIGNGILKGSGHQRNGALINFIAYWCIGLPLGTFLCFTLKLKLNGLWIGMASALFSVMALEFVTIYRINWEKEVEATVKRINKN
ncbi:MATE efflux family protein [Anaeromyces robustus]|uniref:MATE efflux family protein n=1 Tax=Anaeromyces robustus TaxID=1754192 RepID=A0A1Y1XAK3_9FUNG|nr:MATE efflux family protein [Anaeromyces robustus]|eukprot:ORX82466.1 MATE efflux family protein [Anaeromyces robustus]